MAEPVLLTLVSPNGMPIRALVESALQSGLKMIELSLGRVERTLQDFEHKYGLSTAEFYRRLTGDELSETLDFVEWVGEYKTLLRLKQKRQTLQEIQIA
jgi:hypothetical protein